MIPNKHLTLLTGRVFLVMLFLAGSLLKYKHSAGAAAYMRELGVPGAGEPLVVALCLLEFLSALAILVGYQTRKVAMALVVYLIPITWYAHLALVWGPADDVVRDNEIVQTLKNIAIMGGLGLLSVTGPGEYSLDKK